MLNINLSLAVVGAHLSNLKLRFIGQKVGDVELSTLGLIHLSDLFVDKILDIHSITFERLLRPTPIEVQELGLEESLINQISALELPSQNSIRDLVAYIDLPASLPIFNQYQKVTLRKRWLKTEGQFLDCLLFVFNQLINEEKLNFKGSLDKVTRSELAYRLDLDTTIISKWFSVENISLVDGVQISSFIDNSNVIVSEIFEFKESKSKSISRRPSKEKVLQILEFVQLPIWLFFGFSELIADLWFDRNKIVQDFMTSSLTEIDESDRMKKLIQEMPKFEVNLSKRTVSEYNDPIGNSKKEGMYFLNIQDDLIEYIKSFQSIDQLSLWGEGWGQDEAKLLLNNLNLLNPKKTYYFPSSRRTPSLDQIKQFTIFDSCQIKADLSEFTLSGSSYLYLKGKRKISAMICEDDALAIIFLPKSNGAFSFHDKIIFWGDSQCKYFEFLQNSHLSYGVIGQPSSVVINRLNSERIDIYAEQNERIQPNSFVYLQMPLTSMLVIPCDEETWRYINQVRVENNLKERDPGTFLRYQEIVFQRAKIIYHLASYSDCRKFFEEGDLTGTRDTPFGLEQITSKIKASFRLKLLRNLRDKINEGKLRFQFSEQIVYDHRASLFITSKETEVSSVSFLIECNNNSSCCIDVYPQNSTDDVSVFLESYIANWHKSNNRNYKSIDIIEYWIQCLENRDRI